MSEAQTDVGTAGVESVLKGKNGNVEVVNPSLRRRRSRSFSKAESIVTEEEKIRRAQPDKPWVLLLLFLGGDSNKLGRFGAVWGLYYITFLRNLRKILVTDP